MWGEKWSRKSNINYPYFITATTHTSDRVKPEFESEVTWLHDIKQLHVYAQPKKMLSTQEAVGVLLSSGLEESSICARVPFAVEINAALILLSTSTSSLLPTIYSVMTWVFGHGEEVASGGYRWTMKYL